MTEERSLHFSEQVDDEGVQTLDLTHQLEAVLKVVNFRLKTLVVLLFIVSECECFFLSTHLVVSFIRLGFLRGLLMELGHCLPLM